MSKLTVTVLHDRLNLASGVVPAEHQVGFVGVFATSGFSCALVNSSSPRSRFADACLLQVRF